MTIYVDDDAYPYQTVVYIEARFDDQWYVGSGVLVGRNDVLTASHVVYDVNYGVADEVIIHFSYNPAEVNVSYSFRYMEYLINFDPDGDGRLAAGDGIPGASLGGVELDIALISLSEPVGDIYGWMEMDFSFSSGYANATGHPGLYSHYMTNDHGRVWKDPTDHSINISSVEINPGNSGGPIWYDTGSGPYVVGLVSTGLAAVSLSGHSHWLLDSIRDNDRFLPEYDSTKYGTDGNDVFYVDVSIMSYIGLAGIDTINFDDIRGNYHLDITLQGNGTVTHLPTNILSSLSSIERISFLDGTLAFDTDGSAGQAYRLYQAAFDRTPDTPGLSFWIHSLDNGVSLIDAAEGFVLSDEFVHVYGSDLSIEAYVEQLYVNVLGRAGEEAGINFWVDALNGGISYAHALSAFSESDENIIGVLAAIQDGIWYT